MRRALVVTDESARHPFLASLPPHVRKGNKPALARSERSSGMQDLRDFLMAYCACFLAVSTFLL
jgi:hypothetical protein